MISNIAWLQNAHFFRAWLNLCHVFSQFLHRQWNRILASSKGCFCVASWNIFDNFICRLDWKRKTAILSFNVAITEFATFKSCIHLRKICHDSCFFAFSQNIDNYIATFPLIKAKGVLRPGLEMSSLYSLPTFLLISLGWICLFIRLYLMTTIILWSLVTLTSW